MININESVNQIPILKPLKQKNNYICSCGCIINKYNRNQHKLTKKHFKYLKLKKKEKKPIEGNIFNIKIDY